MATLKTAKKTQTTCKELTRMILDYVNGSLSPSMRRAFQHHLRACPDCVSFLKTYKKTVEVTRSVRPGDIPPRVRDNILTFLRKRARQS
jgi:anti-sigma factor RsiW